MTRYIYIYISIKVKHSFLPPNSFFPQEFPQVVWRGSSFPYSFGSLLLGASQNQDQLVDSAKSMRPSCAQ